MVFDLATWLAKATLDAMGLGISNSQDVVFLSSLIDFFAAAFDYHFGTLDNAEDELGNAYANLWLVFMTSPSVDLSIYILQPGCLWVTYRTRHLEAIHRPLHPKADPSLHHKKFSKS
jgi:hypothetical protein